MAPKQQTNSNDDRTRAQKAADTRRANKEAEVRLAHEELSPRRAKANARQNWQSVTGTSKKRTLQFTTAAQAKRTKTDQSNDSDAVGHGDKMDVDEQGEGDDGGYDKKRRYLPANMDDDDDGIIFPPKTAATRTKVVPAKGNATRLPVNRPSSKRVMQVPDTSEPEDSNGESNEKAHLSRGKRQDSDNDDEHTSSGDDDDDNGFGGRDSAHIREVLAAERPVFESPRAPARSFDDDEDDIPYADDVDPGRYEAKQVSNTPADLGNTSSDEPEVEIAVAPRKPNAARRNPLSDISASFQAKGKPAKSRRQEKHDLEKPQWKDNVKATMLPRKQKVKGSKRQWSPAATVVHSAKGDVKLGDQDPDLQRVVRGGITEALRKLIFENAFPAFSSRVEYARTVLLVGARKCGAKEIKERLKIDVEFVEELMDLVIARIAIVRNEFKNAATNIVPSAYDLDMKDPAKVQESTKTAFNKDQYIFPLRNNQYDFNNPFLHDAISTVLRNTTFKSSSSFGNKYPELFKTGKGVPQMPESIVALAATAIHAAFFELRSGEHENVKFQLATFEDTYYSHLATLETMRVKSPGMSQRILSEIYARVNKSKAPTKSSHGSALDVIVFDDED